MSDESPDWTNGPEAIIEVGRYGQLSRTRLSRDQSMALIDGMWRWSKLEGDERASDAEHWRLVAIIGEVERLTAELADRDATIKRLGAMAISKVGRSASLTEHGVMVAAEECEDLRSRLARSEAAIDGAMEQVGDIQPELSRLEREVERLTAERDAALARAERAEGRESILVDKIAHAEAASWAAENGEVDPSEALEDVAATLADVDLRAGEGDASMPAALDGWTYSPTEDRYEGPDERSAYVFDGELTIEGPGLAGHSGIDLSVPVAVARSLLIRSETRPDR